jgi:peptide/nickel transport system permease protein
VTLLAFSHETRPAIRQDDGGPEASAKDLQRLRHKLGLDRPLWIQYAPSFMAWFGDLGMSLTRRSGLEEIFRRLPATIRLAVSAMFFATLTGLIVGILSAVHPRSLRPRLRVGVFVFLPCPVSGPDSKLSSFSLGIWSGSRQQGAGSLHVFHDRHLVLPRSTLGWHGAFLCRILRSSMLQVLNMDHPTTRAKGLDSNRVILKHALKNALIPFITVAGISTGALLGGSVIVETVYNWPGVGKLLVDSIKERDFPVTMGCVLILAVLFVMVNLVVDLLYVVLDPRIRLEGKERV